MILFQFLMVTYLFMVDGYYLNWHISFRGSTSLCAFELDVISNFIWFGCYKARIWNPSSNISWAFHVTGLFTINQHKFLVSCFFCLVFCKTKLVVNVHENIHPLSFFNPVFIHKYRSSMRHGKIFFHITKYFILGVTKYSLNIMSTLEEYSKKDSILLPCSCSLARAHVHKLMK
jgi:hypothetical protein